MGQILNFIGNILWFIFAGIWLFLGHLFTGILLCFTLIGIPFGLQHFKLAEISLFPIGKQIVSNEMSKVISENNAKKELNIE